MAYKDYDASGKHNLRILKDGFYVLEELVRRTIPKDSREKALVLAKLEESFLWVNEAVRAQQIERKQLELGI